MPQVQMRSDIVANAVAIIEGREAFPPSERAKRPPLGIWVVETLKHPLAGRRLSRIKELSDELPEEKTTSADKTIIAQRSHVSIIRLRELGSNGPKIINNFTAIDILRDEEGGVAEISRAVVDSPEPFHDGVTTAYISREDVSHQIYLRDDPGNSTLALGEVVQDLEYAHQQLGLNQAA